jgi:hypothetical protein
MNFFQKVATTALPSNVSCSWKCILSGVNNSHFPEKDMGEYDEVEDKRSREQEEKRR